MAGKNFKDATSFEVLGYHPPVVDLVTLEPEASDTRGGADGSVVTIAGTNFGLPPDGVPENDGSWVSGDIFLTALNFAGLTTTAALEALVEDGAALKISDVSEWTHERVVGRMPAGEGAGQGPEDVADDAVVGQLENRRVGVGVDRDDMLRGAHTGQMLDRAADTAGDVNLRRHDLAGLPDLVTIRPVTGIDRRSR